MKRIFFCILFLIITCIFVKAITQETLDAYRFSYLSQENGLPHNHVECILKDSEGFIWFGTRNGLARFDGYEFKNYFASNKSNSVSGNRVLSLTEDLEGNIWIGTYSNGLNKFNKKTETFTQYGTEYGIGVWINQLKVLSDSSVWVCTAQGLARYDSESDSMVVYKDNPKDPNSINSNGVYDVVRTSKGKYYVATESYFIQTFNPDNGKFTTVVYNRAPELNTNYKKRIVEDRNGVLWISSNVHGLSSYNPETGASDFYIAGENSLTSNVLTGAMVLGPNGNIWIATDGEGVNIFNPEQKTFTYLRKTDKEGSVASNSIYSIYFDDQDIMWLGTFDDGVSYYDPNRYKFNSSLYSPNDLNFLKGKSVLALFQDSWKQIWIGTDGDGLYKIDTLGNIQHFKHQANKANTISTNVITSIDQDKFGNILIGTYAGGFMSYNNNTGTFKYFNQNPYVPYLIASSSVWDILTDSKGRVWLGLLGGGYDRYDPKTERFYNHGPLSSSPQKINFTNVMALFEDSDQNIWFGTEGKGIFILDSKSNILNRLEGDTTLAFKTDGLIKCIYEDQWGQIWIGTEGEGVFVYDKDSKKNVHYDYSNGLPGNIVMSIAEDIAGNIWLGTSSGLSIFDPNTQSFRNHYESDGLNSSSFNQNAMLRLADGRILCGTSKGVDIIGTKQLESNNYAPPIVFTSLKILNQEVRPNQKINNRVIIDKSINYSKQITLTHKEKVFSIEIAALNYTLPEKCLYQYKLEGFNKEWINTTSKNRIISYTNLPAGQYKLRVKASNNDGFWNNNEKTLLIQVLPPFYRTWWFKSLIVLLLLLFLLSLYRYRLNSIRANFQKKQYEQDKRIMQLEKDKLDSELQKLTFHVLNRNRELINQKNRLMGLSMKAKESVRIGLQDIISKLDEELNDDKDWKYIEPQLDKVYNNFVSHLKENHPSLSISEVKIAAYVRMNLSTKEIAEFMHKTSRAIENDRYRLRKKIGLETNDSLKDYLNSL